ncbi:alpha-N-acetylgalactosaminide alpha-2,6-sialyltransferase 6 isoform X2 [Bombina bombina]|uniref:alpha-N-acetylgalactosaminide alpha-2,6-sialyltransferase 6 isoform X2 n=1 Tax=Bombina bombina TaxID=8345 RepID=UPI00235A587A|nr:alpha-N-acetylgalactosaminide alpha-2,6-sialyltransferase 6 isoform X2 [Bombina bombina]XP_053551839.1 alpha-N-acetylgalactosaminide alpha-2,6-sialyltransferase 6 isoform X2 [Bombina bombina]
MSNNTGRTTALILIFAFVTFLIILSSNNNEEPFNYRDLKLKHHNPPNIRKWSLQDGYISVSGNKTLQSKCNSCVIVTSSSHLLNTLLGPKIDQSECIIRMNDAPTAGYEKDVGNRTTFRVVAHSSVPIVLRRPQEFLSRSPGQTLIFWGPPNRMQQNSKTNLYHIIHRASMAFPNVSAFVVSPRNMMRFDQLFQAETGRDREKSHSWLSTGWFTMVIAVELCNKVHVYGMVPPNYCSDKRQHKMPYHYYEPKGPDECVTYIQNERGNRGSHHRFITEKLVFARWASVYNISFSHPEWFSDLESETF